MSLDGGAEKAIELEADRVIVVNRWRGGLGKISLFQIAPTGLKVFPPLMLIAGVCLRKEFKEATRRVRSSVITVEPENSPELKRIAGYLSQFFGLPVLSADEIAEKHGASMNLSFGSSRRLQITFMLLSRIFEMGPRITLSKLIWEVSI